MADQVMIRRNGARRSAQQQHLSNAVYLAFRDFEDKEILEAHVGNTKECMEELRQLGCQEYDEYDYCFKDIVAFSMLQADSLTGITSDATADQIEAVLNLRPLRMPQKKAREYQIQMALNIRLSNRLPAAFFNYVTWALNQHKPDYKGFKPSSEPIPFIDNDRYNGLLASIDKFADEFMRDTKDEIFEDGKTEPMKMSANMLTDIQKVYFQMVRDDEDAVRAQTTAFCEFVETVPDYFKPSDTMAWSDRIKGDPDQMIPSLLCIQNEDDLLDIHGWLGLVLQSIIFAARLDPDMKVLAGVKGGCAKYSVNFSKQDEPYLVCPRHDKTEFQPVTYQNILLFFSRRLAGIIEKIINFLIQILGMSLSWNDASMLPESFGDYDGPLLYYLVPLISLDAYKVFKRRSMPITELNFPLIVAQIENIISGKFPLLSYVCHHTSSPLEITPKDHVPVHFPRETQKVVLRENQNVSAMVLELLADHGNRFSCLEQIGLYTESFKGAARAVQAIFAQTANFGIFFAGCSILRNKNASKRESLRYYPKWRVYVSMISQCRSGPGYFDIEDFKPRTIELLRRFKEAGRSYVPIALPLDEEQNDDEEEDEVM